MTPTAAHNAPRTSHGNAGWPRAAAAAARASRRCGTGFELVDTRSASLRRVSYHVLITGGSGFVGANLCVGLAERHPDWTITAFDNLKRRGSKLNLPRLRAAGVRFVHGDVRAPGDLLALPRCDALVECSAEPSALAGVGESPDYLV